MMILAARGVKAGCWSPRCEECEVKVEQESPSRVTLDWSHDWWDLNLQCLDILSLTLNGELLVMVRYVSCPERPSYQKIKCSFVASQKRGLIKQLVCLISLLL